MTDLPLLGVAVEWSFWPDLRDWVLGPGRDVEVQDFCEFYMIGVDPAERIADWQRALKGHTGRIGLHGPYLGNTMGNPDPLMREVFRQRVREHLDIAAAMNATQVVIHSPYTRWLSTNRWNRGGYHGHLAAIIAEELAPLLARADELGIELVVENIQDDDPTDRVALVAGIDHPRLAVSLDTGHAQLAGGQFGAPPVVDFIAAAGARLRHVHLQDADGWADRHWHPGAGTLPWPPIFAALAQHAPDARLILEVIGNFPGLPASVAALEARGLAR